jgi:CRISPR type I-E-associated protein CasB/Cse2
MGQAIAILNAAEVPVDWQRLLGDLSRWYEPGAPVQNAWLDGYFGNA